MLATPKQIKALKINKYQLKLMTSAGFVVIFHPPDFDRMVKDKNAMITWKRGDIKIAISRNKRMSIADFTDRVIDQIFFRTTKQMRETLSIPQKPLFPTTNI